MKTKLFIRILLLSILILVFAKTNAQSPSYQWVKAIGGTSYDIGNVIAIDSESGDVYTTGVFSGTVDFDPGGEMFNLTSAGGNDIFILKSNAFGHFVWAKKMGGTLNDVGFSIAVDATGNVYATGQFSKTVDFDPGPDIFNLTSAGSVDIFIIKLDSSGNLIWAKSIGGNSYDVGKSLAIDPSGTGDIYIKGEFSGTVDFDPGTDTFYLKTANYKGIFILKLDDSGNFVWAKNMDVDAYGGFGQSIIVDESGNIYTTGWFHGTVDFDSGNDTFNLTATGVNDIFISKLNAYGNFVWAKNMRGTLQGVGHSLALDAWGNVYTIGTFNGTIDFDPNGSIYNLTSRSSVFGNIFISKLDGSGNFVWAKAMGGTGGDSGHSIVVDPGNEDIYIVGNFTGTADFDPDKGIFNLTSAGDLDVFISKLDGSGNFVWSKAIGGINADYGFSIALSGSGNVHVMGGFRNSPIYFSSTPLPNAGDYDIFLAKLNVIPSITGIPDSICEASLPTLLPTTQSNLTGSWSGAGVSNNILEASGLNGKIDLTFTPDSGQCGSPIVHEIIINPATTPFITDLPSSVSETSPPIQLPLIQSGLVGNWYGQGVANNMFDPAGLYGVISLTFNPDPGQCAIAITADIIVELTNTYEVYLPTIFSPNGDGINDVVTIHGTSVVRLIKSMRFFSRWGEVVYERYNFPPNDPGYGWDGSHNGQKLNPGVYAWVAEVEFVDGKVELFSGGVTLIR